MRGLVVAGLMACAPAMGGVVLYDGALNTSPAAQGWLAYAQVPFTPSYTATAGGKTTLDSTSSSSIQAGFASYSPSGSLLNPSFPTLNRTAGFGLEFDARLLAESHSSNDRAGLSLTAITSDLRGIELGFWTNEIWAQNDNAGGMFTHGEGAAWNTGNATQYLLWIQGSSYSLSANGSEILAGSLRDYTPWTKPALAPYDPYELANFVYVGDNTTSAAGRFEFSRLAVVPEPSALLLLGASTILMMRSRRG